MKRITALLFLALFAVIPMQVFGIGHNAGHVFEKDGLWGWGDSVVEDGCTRYHPDLDSLPAGVVIDEIYLFIRFKEGQEPDVNQIGEIR